MAPIFIGAIFYCLITDKVSFSLSSAFFNSIFISIWFFFLLGGGIGVPPLSPTESKRISNTNPVSLKAFLNCFMFRENGGLSVKYPIDL